MEKTVTFSKLGEMGRLGNQIFQIACTIATALDHNATPKFPANWKYREHFNIPDEFFQSDIPKSQKIYRENGHRFEKIELKDFQTVDLEGYFQSVHYFEKHKEKIFEYLTPKNCTPSKKNALAVHHRRGDYINNINYHNLGWGYYLNSIDYFDQYCNYDELVGFSDDPHFVNVHYIGNHLGQLAPKYSEIEDFKRIIECDKHICSNSTFSFWGAYLSGSKNVIAPKELFSGHLLQQYGENNTMYPEYFRIEKDEKWKVRDIFSIIIPVMFDHRDRIDNLYINLNLLNYADFEIIVGEIKTREFERIVQQMHNVKYMHFDYQNFHRTKALNEMTKISGKKYVLNLDADVIISPIQMQKTLKLLRGGWEFVYPYDGRFGLVPKKMHREIFLNGIECLSEKKIPNMEKSHFSVGGLVAFNSKKYWEIGGENEKFISYAPEDVERWERYKLLKCKVARVEGALYHLEHFRGMDSGAGNVFFKISWQELERLRKMTKEEMIEEIKTWKWANQNRVSSVFSAKEAEIEHVFDLSFASVLANVFSKSEIVNDIGSGVGWYSHFLSRRGFDCNAYEPCPENLENLSFCKIEKYDITKDNFQGNIGQTLFLEVGEHISEENEKKVIDNICSISKKIIVMSWAIEGQEGCGHVNCKNNDYIISEMNDRGWAIDKEKTDFVRNAATNCSWLKKSAMVFVSNQT